MNNTNFDNKSRKEKGKKKKNGNYKIIEANKDESNTF
jgi:hypothetical protein